MTLGRILKIRHQILALAFSLASLALGSEPTEWELVHRTSVASNDALTVHVFEGEFVLWRPNSPQFFSDNGQEWTKEQRFPRGIYYNTITYTGSVWLSMEIGNELRILQEPWSRWTVADETPEAMLGYATDGQGTWLAVGEGGLMSRSIDNGLTWAPSLSTATADISHVIYGEGQWFALERNGESRFWRWLTSVDGHRWDRGEMEPVPFNENIAPAGSLVVFVNGIWWSLNTSLELSFPSGPIQDLPENIRPDIVYANETFVEVGGGLRTSVDGVNWTERALSGDRVTSAAYADGVWIVTTRGGLVWRSEVEEAPVGGMPGTVETPQQLDIAPAVELTWTGKPGTRYWVQRSTDLEQWQDDAPPVEGEAGRMSVFRSREANEVFFRVISR